ncbi:uncharacterized [Tachysurus ichikawai]
MMKDVNEEKLWDAVAILLAAAFQPVRRHRHRGVTFLPNNRRAEVERQREGRSALEGNNAKTSVFNACRRALAVTQTTEDRRRYFSVHLAHPIKRVQLVATVAVFT